MKIIFLDIDGVLNTYNSMDRFCPKAVSCLNEFVQESGAKVVISSSWRLSWKIEEMREYFVK